MHTDDAVHATAFQLLVLGGLYGGVNHLPHVVEGLPGFRTGVDGLVWVAEASFQATLDAFGQFFHRGGTDPGDVACVYAGELFEG